MATKRRYGSVRDVMIMGPILDTHQIRTLTSIVVLVIKEYKRTSRKRDHFLYLTFFSLNILKSIVIVENSMTYKHLYPTV